MGLWSTIKNIGKSVVKGVSNAGEAVIGGAVDVATSWLGNEVITQPNAQTAFNNSKEASALQYQRSQDAATTSWNRSKEAAKTSHDWSVEDTQRAYELDIDAYKNRYRWTMADMKAAGLNPILAAGSGFTVTGQPQATPASAYMAQAPMAQPVSAQSPQAYPGDTKGTQSILNLQKREESKKNITKIMEEALKARAHALEAITKIATHRQQKNLMTAQEQEVYKRIRVLEKEWFVRTAQFYKTVFEGYKIKAETDVSRETKQKVKAEAQRIIKQTALLKSQLDILSKTADVYKGPIGSTLAYIKQIMEAVIPIAGIVAGGKILGGK